MPRRSKAQKLQSLLNLAKGRQRLSGASGPKSSASMAEDKENTPPLPQQATDSASSAPGGPLASLTDGLRKLQVEVTRQKKRAQGFFRDLRNGRRREERARKSADKAREDLKSQKQESDTAIQAMQSNLRHTMQQLRNALATANGARAEAEAQHQLATTAQSELAAVKVEAEARVSTIWKASAQEVADVTRISEEQVARVRAELFAVRCQHARLEQEKRTIHLTLQSTLDRIRRRYKTLVATNRALSKRLSRLPSAFNRVLLRVKQSAIVERGCKLRLKKLGVITPAARRLVRELVASGVPVKKVNRVIGGLSRLTGVTIVGSIDTRSVRRIVLEGGIAAKMQVVEEISRGDGFTASGDGTTHKHINYESRNLYVNKGDTHTRRFLGISSAPNHTSEMQLHGWQKLVGELYDVYNSSPRGQDKPIDTRQFTDKLRGMNTDHAEDQKKLHRLVAEWKTRNDREVRGERALAELPTESMLRLVTNEMERAVSDAGGVDAWLRLSPVERAARYDRAIVSVKMALGEAAFKQLPAADQRQVSLFVSSFCCMHKDLNAVKGGNTDMMAYWKEAGRTPPLLLMNRDNDATAQVAGPSMAAANRALQVSVGGAIKFLELAGSVFRHRDDKKGHQDSYRWYFEYSPNVDELVQFPNVSSVRFGSFGDAASEIVVHLPVYIEFLEHARDKKILMNHSHMEKNVYRALKDQPTLTELCALALYSQAISHPYLHEVHRPDSSQVNHLNLGPLHERVRAHCKAITEQPGRLLAPDASHTLGSLDGKEWERPEAFTAVHRLHPILPDLENIMVHFFQGALKTWDRFCAEFNPGGLISSLSITERREAWACPTNDDNKGGLGTYRVCARLAPTMTLHQHNAREMYKLNQTANYVDTFTEAEHRFLQEAARKEDGSGLERKRRQEQIQWEMEQVAAKRRKMVERAQKKDALFAKLRALTRISDPNAITEALINAHLDLQLDWYRTFVDPLTGSTAVKVPKKNAVGLKALKITALKDAITRYELLSPEIREDVEARVGGLETDNDVVGKAAGEESDDDV